MRQAIQSIPPFARRAILASIGLAPIAYLAIRALCAAADALARAQGLK